MIPCPGESAPIRIPRFILLCGYLELTPFIIYKGDWSDVNTISHQHPLISFGDSVIGLPNGLNGAHIKTKYPPEYFI